MFGYVTIYRKGLAKEDLDRYQALYMTRKHSSVQGAVLPIP